MVQTNSQVTQAGYLGAILDSVLSPATHRKPYCFSTLYLVCGHFLLSTVATVRLAQALVISCLDYRKTSQLAHFPQGNQINLL